MPELRLHRRRGVGALMGEKTKVLPGQIWEDCDKRAEGRRVRVVAVGGTYAQVRVFAPRAAGTKPDGTVGRTTRIRLDRFQPTSTGYRLVKA